MNERSANGSMEQVTASFLAGRRTLIAYIHWLVRDPHVAEDIFQEVWLKLANALNRGDRVEDQARWCRGVARNLVLHHWRDQRDAKVVADSEFVDLVEAAFDEAEPDDWSDRRHALAECLQTLPEKSRQLLGLKYESGCSIAAIAITLRQSVDAVTKSLLRLRRALASCVERRVKLSGLGL